MTKSKTKTIKPVKAWALITQNNEIETFLARDDVADKGPMAIYGNATNFNAADIQSYQLTRIRVLITPIP